MFANELDIRWLMNLLLLPDLAEEAVLSARDPRLEHVRGVLRLQVGDGFDVGAENGPLGRATILRIDREAVVLRLAWGERPPPPPPPIDLLVALPRPATARKIVMEATTLGVRSLRFFPGGKSDPAFAKSRFWTDQGWREARRLGAEQAFTTWLPPVTLATGMAETLSELPPHGLRMAPDVYEATASLNNVLAGIDTGGTALAIGPERGWNATDRALLRAQGFTLCSLGNRVLRVETATTVSIALVLARLGAL